MEGQSDLVKYKELSRQFTGLTAEIIGLEAYNPKNFRQQEKYENYARDIESQYETVRRELDVITHKLNINHEINDRKIILTKGIQELKNIVAESNHDGEIDQAMTEIERYEHALKILDKKKKTFLGIF